MYDFQNTPHTFPQTDLRAIARARLVRSALILSVIAICLFATGYLSLIPAGVAFIMAVVSLGSDTKPSGNAKVAMVLSLAAVALSYLTIVYTIVRYIIPAFRSPELAGELDTITMENYGVSFQELLDMFAQQFGISR